MDNVIEPSSLSDRIYHTIDNCILFGSSDTNHDLVSELDNTSAPHIDFDTIDAPKLTICTIHGSKGLEWPVVFIPGCEENIIPHYYKEETNLEEEKRLFYVGITRAKELLILSRAKYRKTWAKDVQNDESSFLKVNQLL